MLMSGESASASVRSIIRLLTPSSFAPGPVMMIELTGGGLGLAVPLVIATATATLLARRVDGYSIYRVRLPVPDWPSV